MPGASGIVIPHCESAEEVRHLQKELYYPPIGQRSFSPWTFTPGVNDASLYEDDEFNMKTSNNHIVLIPQIESVKGVENVEAIAAVENVGALMFGPGDFMAAAGLKMTMSGAPHPVMLDAMAKFSAAGKKAGLPLLGAAHKEGMVPMLLEQGYRIIAIAFDVWGLAGMVKTNLMKAKADAEEAGKKFRGETNGEATNGETKDVAINGKQ